MKDETTVSG